MRGFNAGDKIPELLKNGLVKLTKPLTALGIVEADINKVKVYLPFCLFNVDPNDSTAVGSIMNPTNQQGFAAEDVFAGFVATHFSVRLAKSSELDWDQLKVVDSSVKLSDLKKTECKILRKDALSSGLRKMYKRSRSTSNRMLAFVHMEHPNGIWLSLPVDCFNND